MYKFVVAGILIMASATGYVVYHRLSSGTNGPGVEIDWRLLSEMDYITGDATPELKNIDNQRVKIPGFMVPLEDNIKEVKEFLLVPSPQACIHVPPPPPNQMVYVRMKANKGTESLYGPIWAYGTFRIVTKKSIYGESSFELESDGIEAYR
ncbi:MAG: DUF3299 domain-containing protein [Pseudobdellovibrionaceae bacterium]